MAAEIAKVEDLPEVVRRLVSGEATLRQLAEERGVAHTTLYRWLLSDLGDERYRELVTDALIARIADADVELAGAKSVLEVQRAREIARFARMDFERRRPALYGVKQEVKHTVAPVLHIHTTAPAVDVTPVPSALPAPLEGR